MSLTRQIWLLLMLTLLLALLGGASVHLLSARGALLAELRLENGNGAAALALALSQQRGDRAAMDRLLTVQADRAAYRQIRFLPADGSAPFDRAGPPAAGEAPRWFVRWVGIEPPTHRAAVDDGTRTLGTLGTLELTGSVGSAHDALWRSSLHALAALGAVGLATALLGTLALWRIRRPLAAAMRQASALAQGRFVSLPEPPAPEVATLTRGMNAMVARLKATFDGQAQQLELLRLRAHCDTLTGLSNRQHFLGQLEASLQREDGAAQCGLVLLRLRDLAGVNHALGHGATDRILGAIAQTLQPYAERVPGCFLGRLNGADFALCLPVGGLAHETALAIAAALQALLPSIGQSVSVAAGAVELQHETPLAHALADADEALARAEARGAYAVELGSQSGRERAGRGEAAWRQGLAEALSDGRAQLAAFALIDPKCALVHLECPLRLQLEADGVFEVAARWLPLAVRVRMTAAVDARAVALALEAIGADGLPRCVNLAPASLADGGFAARLRTLLFAAPRAARRLSLEIDEAAAIDRFAPLQELARQLRPCGVRLGLEHAGARLGQIERLIELGLDFVKLDASATRGVASDPQRLGFVRGSVDLLHGLSLRVYAEGVADDGDARALWACGVDGVTGPWATAHGGATPAR